MSRITAKNLQAVVKSSNRLQMASGSTWFYRSGGRNGHQAVDLCRIKPDGVAGRERVLEIGTPRECIDAMHHHQCAYSGYIFPQTTEQVTREQALTALEIYGIDFADVDGSTYLTVSELEVLATWAKLTRYRKPRNAGGSAGQYFFEHLAKLKRRSRS